MAFRIRSMLGKCFWYVKLNESISGSGMESDWFTEEADQIKLLDLIAKTTFNRPPLYAYCEKFVKEGRRIVRREIKRYYYTPEDLAKHYVLEARQT